MTPQRGVIVQKPKTNIYTMMLIIALLAMCIACVFLLLEGMEYDRPPNALRGPATGGAPATIEAAFV